MQGCLRVSCSTVIIVLPNLTVTYRSLDLLVGILLRYYPHWAHVRTTAQALSFDVLCPVT